MRLSTAIVATLPLAANAANLLLSNDDGWAEKNIRVFYDTLTAAGENVVLSAPAENKSDSDSSSEEEATPRTEEATPRREPCEFDSCPANSPAVGADSKNPRLNYVNAYPVDAIRYGIQTLSPTLFGQNPDLVVTGPNVGPTLGLVTRSSGTVDAATEGSIEGIPGIAFSGDSGSQISSTEATPLYAQIYAELATNVTQTLLASGAPYLPSSTYLNVNFPAVSSSQCSNVGDFKFVLSRIYAAVAVLTPPDVETCGGDRLPTESSVLSTDGCYASISLATASKTYDASPKQQATALEKLKPILSCLPG